jgi:peptidoglycan/xylan/chitin deacetylase (PgdA/CDA1 family)
LAIADFATSGLEASLGTDAAKLLRQGLAGSPLLDLKQSARVQDLLGSSSARILANKPGVAQGVADQLSCRVLVYGVLRADAGGERFLQLTGVDCRPRVARLYATPPLTWPTDRGEQQARLLSALQAVLPPVGRVLAVITAEGKTDIQVFPFAGNPLRGDTTYLAFHTRSAEPTAERPDFLPPLWNGDFSGRLSTTPERMDDVTLATPEAGAQIEIGDLVGLALTQEVAAIPSTGRLVLSDPPFAQVVKGDKVLGLTPLLLPADSVPGDFTLALANYEQKPITLAAATGLLADEFTLKELPRVGALRVTSDPDGATVLLDGKEIGKTPVVYPNVPPGKHTLSLRLAGYVTADREVQVERAQASEAHFPLERQTRAVRVVSDPAGAQVTWDGQGLGQAPAVVAKAPVGAHTVRLSLAGYDEVEQQVQIEPGDKPAEFTFPLARLVGRLKITSDPAGAQIAVAGKPRGAAPVELADLAPGQYEVSATLEGYREAKRTVTVKARDTAEVRIALARQVGAIDIKTVPAGAKITLDGEDRGTSPAQLEDVPVGEHKLRLEVANLRPWEGKVTVTDAQTTRVQVGLLPLQVEMKAQPGAQPLPTQPPPPTPSPTPGLAGPAPPGGGREFEGSDEPVSFALLDFADGQRQAWSVPLLREGDPKDSPSDQLKLDFQPHADGSMTVGIRTRQPLPPRVDFEREDGVLIAGLPGLRAVHNPSGVRVKEAPLHGVRLTNTGPGGELQLTLTLASGAQVVTSGAPDATGELVLKVRRPLLMGNSKLVALTFDDTPFAGYTERLLQLLREYRVVATLFVVGHKAADMPNLIRQAHDDGHSVQNHSQTHPKLTTLSGPQVKFELQRCSEVIKQITGEAPRFYRAPGGGDNAEVIRIARSLGMIAAGWDVNVHDYDTPQAQVIADRVVQGTRAGDIILLHDGVEPTLQALPDIITRLRREGFVFVTLNRLLSPER